MFKNYYYLHAGALEAITMDGSELVTTNSDGNVFCQIPSGTHTFVGSISGESFTRTITSDDTDVYVMPDGALYWYGNTCGYNITYGRVSLTYEINRIIASQTSDENFGVYFTDSINVKKYSKICTVANATSGWFAIYAELDGKIVNSFDNGTTSSNYCELFISGNVLQKPRIAGGVEGTKAVVYIYAFWLE